MNESIKAAAEQIKKCESFLLLTHEGPDGDAIGSVSAVGLALKNMGKSVDYAVGRGRLDFSERISETAFFNGDLKERYDAVIVCDCSTTQYIYASEHLKKGGCTILFDHHKTNGGFGDTAVVIPECAACGEIIFMLLKYMKADITPEIAESLYIAISTDTGCFAYSNTTELTHMICAQLYGYMPGGFAKTENFLKLREQNSLKLLKIAMENVELYADGKLAMTSLTYKAGYDDSLGANTDYVTDTLRYVKGVAVTVLIRQTDNNKYKISMRSNSDDADVSTVSASFGGGGHMRAAGFNYEGNLDKLRAYFKDYAETL